MNISQLQALQPGQQCHFQSPGAQPQAITVQSNDGTRLVFLYNGGPMDGTQLTFLLIGLQQIPELVP